MTLMGERSVETAMVGSFDVTDLERRLANLVRLGTVEQADYETARVRVRIGDLLTGWLPWLTQRSGLDAVWWAPEVDEQVLVLAPCGDLALAVVLAGMPRELFPPLGDRPTVHRTRYHDGTVVEYDREAHRLTVAIAESGSVEINATKVTVTADEINLGGEGGPRVARVGDRVNVQYGSSAGMHPIAEGSTIVSATG